MPNTNTQKLKERIAQLAQFRGEVGSETELRHLRGVEAGQVFWLTNKDAAYVVAEKNGPKIKLTPLDMGAAVSTGLTVYDRDKIIAEQAPVISEEQLMNDNDLVSWLKNFEGQNLLIYSRDTHYFTLIEKKNPDMWATNITGTFLRLVRDIGEAVGYEVESTHIELWIRLNSGEVGQFMAFNFDNGVITL